MVVGRHKSFDPDEKLQEAMRIFWENGYHNTKLDTIVSTLKLGKRSFYDTFGSKEELFIKSLEKYFESGGIVIGMLNAPDAGLQTIKESMTFMLDFTVNDPVVKSCLMANSILELGNIHPEIGLKSEKYLKSLTEGFENALHNAMERGEIKSLIDVKPFAMLLSTTYLGSNIMSRGGYTPKQIKQTVEQLFSLL